MKFSKKELLQKEIPTNKWLVKDTNKKVIRAQSQNVLDQTKLSEDEILCMHKLMDFVRYSQDEILNFKEGNNDYLRPAVGLAAPQIGVNKNMFYIRVDYKDDSEPKEIAAINAKIVASSVQITALSGGEGCLSVDGDKKGYVPRKFKIEVKYFDFLKGIEIEETLKGYEAVVFQHELDHINGKLYYDRINKDEPMYDEKDWIFI